MRRRGASRSSTVAILVTILATFQLPSITGRLQGIKPQEVEGSTASARLDRASGDRSAEGRRDSGSDPDAWVHVDSATHHYTDGLGRTRIFHGMNAVYKKTPYYPMYSSFDPANSLSEEDAANLAQWGFNVVRLGVLWPGVEPRRGHYDAQYLDHVSNIVEMLGRHRIYTIVDNHQDLLSRRFCGEGIPAWAQELLSSAAPVATLSFPLPLALPYKVDSGSQGPEWDRCLQKTFVEYYLSEGVSDSFQALYDNHQGVLDSLEGYWRVVADKFKDNPWVLGYELINEPWVGGMYQDPKLLAEPGYAEREVLQPLYRRLHDAIRQVDDRHIVFYEGFAWSYWPSGFTETPGGKEYADRTALSYHMYCPLTGGGVASAVCKLLNEEYMLMRDWDVRRLGGGGFLTEFGAVPNTTDAVKQLEQVTQMADRRMGSWAYWAFKDYQDITTINAGHQSLYEKGQEAPDPAKLAALSRPYAHAVAGSPHEMSFNPATKEFHLKFTPRPAEQQPWGDWIQGTLQGLWNWLPGQLPASSQHSSPDSETLIHVPTSIHYPEGFNVVIKPAGAALLLHADGCGGTEVTVVNSPRHSQGQHIEIFISPCSSRTGHSRAPSCLCTGS